VNGRVVIGTVVGLEGENYFVIHTLRIVTKTPPSGETNRFHVLIATVIKWSLMGLHRGRG